MTNQKHKGESEELFEVEDERDLVAREKKKMIIESRKQLNKIQIQISLSGTPEGVRVDALATYSQVVQQFLGLIEPLLANSEVKGADEAYHRTHLGELTVIPPVKPSTDRPDHLQDSTPQWVKNNDFDLILHRFSDSVEPESFNINGLKEIIVGQGRSVSWDVVIDKQESKGFDGQGPKNMTVQGSQRWTGQILSNAVRTADQFLENANIGLSLAESEPDDGFLDL